MTRFVFSLCEVVNRGYFLNVREAERSQNVLSGLTKLEMTSKHVN